MFYCKIDYFGGKHIEWEHFIDMFRINIFATVIYLN